MMQKTSKEKIGGKMGRPPIVVVLGHVDHGKSTLLDYIRKTNVAGEEAGGITQHTYAYEIVHTGDHGEERKITFLDTPGHEAFSLMRKRGAKIADIAILVVAANDSVKKQTVEAIQIIKAQKIPYLVAITKIDMQGASVEKVKQDLAGQDVLLEGYGGTIPFVPISSKTGEGIPDLITVVLLLADIAELEGDPSQSAEGFVIESHRDPKRGVSATLVIKNGTLKKGLFAVSSGSFTPVRRIENFLGDPVEEASFSSPVQIMGWDETPPVGASFQTVGSKKEAMSLTVFSKSIDGKKETRPRMIAGVANTEEKNSVVIPLVIKADTLGTLEAVSLEILKIQSEQIEFNILDKSIGNIGEADMKRAASDKKPGENPLVLGFNVLIEDRAQALGDRFGITSKVFNIIYELTAWLQKEAERRRPRIRVEELVGRAKIIKVFSSAKNKHVVGGKVLEGKLVSGKTFKLLRRNFEIDTGKILGLEQKKEKAHEVEKGLEYGSLIETKHTPAAGDTIEIFTIVEK